VSFIQMGGDPLHVVEVIQAWPPETFIVRHLAALETHTSLKVTVAAKSPSVQRSSSIQVVEAAVLQVEVVKLPNFDYMRPYAKLASSLAALSQACRIREGRPRDWAILRSFNSMRPDLVHFHFGSLAADLVPYVRRLGIPYTVSIRGSDIQVGPLMSEEYARRLSDTLVNARAIHTVCDEFGERVEAISACAVPITTIRTCVPIPGESIVPSQPDAPIRLITVGRLHWRKAYHDLIRAMSYAPELTLEIVGDGPEREHLTYLIHALDLGNRVRLVGNLPYHEFSKRLTSATAFVQTSVAEGFSNSLAEAMAMGKPVLTTDVGGTGELVRDWENGIILPVGDPAGIASKLALARDGDLMRRIGSAARETAQQHFDAKHHAQQFERLFRHALSR
jgi:colanic acid/amylovoran biosynthesis glycosyltransferase